ncbi:MAG: tRNA (guanine(10)-N(2))-dimethyltransferase [Candidatus Heimdallarchaeota archaeon]
MINYPLALVKEGITPVLVPDVDAIKKPTTTFAPKDAPVFYNKEMELNRDFALACLRAYLKSQQATRFRYCEPMAGTGIRSLRVANEVPGGKVLINDINPFAFALIKKNVRRLKLRQRVSVCRKEANTLLLEFASRGRGFQVIDLDPFGSPAPFLDAVAQAIEKKGLLAITSTDMATKCGVYPQACVRKYASRPIHSSIGHELAVRILLGSTITALARHGKTGVPFFVHSTAHYIRIYVLVEKSITKAKEAMGELGFVSHCPQCFAIESRKGIVNSLKTTCPNCSARRLIGGPLWLGKLFHEEFLTFLEKELISSNSVYGSIKKMKKMFSLIQDEAQANASLQALIGYYDIHQISDKLNVPSPALKVVTTALQKAGYIATRTHFRLNAIKTDAPVNKIVRTIKDATK